VAAAGAAEGSAGSHGCGVWACGALGSSHKQLPTASRYTPGAGPLLPPLIKAPCCTVLVCVGHSPHGCWGWASTGDAGPRSLIPAASLRHGAAGWILHRVSFAQSKDPPVPEKCSLGSNGHHVPSKPRLGAPQSQQNLPSKPATARFEHGRAAGVSRGAWGCAESLWEETAPAWAGRAPAGGGQQGGTDRERHPDCPGQEIVLSVNIFGVYSIVLDCQ